MGEWSLFALTAGGVAALVVAVFALWPKSTAPERLVPADLPDADPKPVLGDMTDALAHGLPGGQRDKDEILPILRRAGYYGPDALTQYKALRALFTLAPLFVAAVVALLVEPRHVPVVAVSGLVVAALGYSLPRVVINFQATRLGREIERGLPVFADMMSISLLAGQGVFKAFSRVVEQLREPFPRMGRELGIVLKQAELMNLGVAFEQWADRSQLPEVRNLAVILTQSQMLGNDVSDALREYAIHLRSGARVRADAKAQRASFWMLFPTILCLWIPAAVVMVGPVYYEFSARRTKAREALPQMDPDNQIGKTLNRGKRE